jgi:hypothetical protein
MILLKKWFPKPFPSKISQIKKVNQSWAHKLEPLETIPNPQSQWPPGPQGCALMMSIKHLINLIQKIYLYKIINN